MESDENAAPRPLLDRWLSAAPRVEERPAEPVRRAQPIAAATTPARPRSAAELFAELERAIARALPPAEVRTLGLVLAPIRAALEPGATADPKALVPRFEQVEDLLEAFLFFRGTKQTPAAD